MVRTCNVFLGLLMLWQAQISQAADPQWIWSQAQQAAAGEQACLLRHFDIDKLPQSATLRAVAGYCHAVFYVNGQRIGSREPYGTLLQTDITERLKRGRNTIGVCSLGVEGPSAVMLRLDFEFENGQKQAIVSDNRWKTVAINSQRLDWPSADELKSKPVETFGNVARWPWGELSDTVTVRPLDDYAQWKQAQGDAAATDPATFQLLAGFEIELLHAAKPKEGSWVSMAFDPQGRLIVAMERQGLLRLTLPRLTLPKDKAAGVRVETINEKLRECRGLLFAHDSLYAMSNNDKGLYRLRDTNGDGQFDQVRLLKKIDGDVGHGRNQLTLGPDNMIYAIFGDAVYEPAGAKTLPPPIARPTGVEKTRSGFLARTDSEGSRWEVLVRGLRNPYGVAFNTDGEAFTYDADAEYDMAAPWYRPTRVDHLVSAGDFGWRRVTQRWPPYVPDRPDMPQPTLDIGKGSPTSVAFGTGSAFPPRYQKALYVLDWSYGRILAVHLTPHGSSYAAKAETFLRGRPANVTDIAFGPDGAMVFITGGRRTRSALYRVRYTGPNIKPDRLTSQQRQRQQHAAASRGLRRSLEQLHGQRDRAAIAKAWPHLGSDDPWIRHAARSAIEWQPAKQWQQRALDEKHPQKALAALLALVRVGPKDAQDAIVARLQRIPFEKLSESQKLTVLFIYDRCLGVDEAVENTAVNNTVNIAIGASVMKALDRHFPDDLPAVNRRLSLLLKRLAAPRIVDRSISLLSKADNQQETMHYLFLLRNVKDGWTPQSRETYFQQMKQFDSFVGGEGMPTFRRLIENEAIASLPAGKRDDYKKLLQQAGNRWLAEIPHEKRPHVRQWKLGDFDNLQKDLAAKRDVPRGERMFAVAQCIGCHRKGDRGGVVGPDLSAIASRFSPRDMLLSILEPSRAVSEKYRAETFLLDDGRTITGRVITGGDFRSPRIQVRVDPLDPTKTITFAKSEVDAHQQSSISPMPLGLVETLTRGEILDLLAYLLTGLPGK